MMLFNLHSTPRICTNSHSIPFYRILSININFEIYVLVDFDMLIVKLHNKYSHFKFSPRKLSFIILMVLNLRLTIVKATILRQ